VATRKPGPPPAGQNGLGLTPNQASQWLRSCFCLIDNHADPSVLVWNYLELSTLTATPRLLSELSKPNRILSKASTYSLK
jgi:hypothetical protein